MIWINLNKKKWRIKDPVKTIAMIGWLIIFLKPVRKTVGYFKDKFVSFLKKSTLKKTYMGEESN